MVGIRIPGVISSAALCVVMCSVSAHVLGADPAAELQRRQRELTQIDHALAASKRQLERDLARRDEATQALAAAETDAGTARAGLAKLDRALGETDERLQTLGRQMARSRSALETGGRDLARQLRAAYMVGRQDRLKLLLNLQDASSLQRVIAYHGYWARARERQIASVREVLAEQQRLQAQLEAASVAQERLRQEVQRQLATLEQANARRRAALTSLEHEVASKDQQVAELIADRLRLQQLVARLEKAIAAAKARADADRAFASQRGKLPWPVQGHMVAGFGQAGSGNVGRQGLLIGAGAGEEVRAVHAGRVVFADWLPGYGLVMILDHGKGYLSIYAHNQALFEQVGADVGAGEVIAAVGDTGGARQHSLYFEIREGGRAVDPRLWLARR